MHLNFPIQGVSEPLFCGLSTLTGVPIIEKQCATSRLRGGTIHKVEEKSGAIISLASFPWGA